MQQDIVLQHGRRSHSSPQGVYPLWLPNPRESAGLAAAVLLTLLLLVLKAVPAMEQTKGLPLPEVSTVVSSR